MEDRTVPKHSGNSVVELTLGSKTLIGMQVIEAFCVRTVVPITATVSPRLRRITAAAGRGRHVDPDDLKGGEWKNDYDSIVCKSNHVIDDNVDSDSAAHGTLYDRGTYAQRTLVANIAARGSSYARTNGLGVGWQREQRC
jgi:hypothetical protein